MKTIHRKISVDIIPTPFELAEMFCEGDSTMQAEFFNAIACITDHMWDKPFATQLQSLTDDNALNDGGRSVMNRLSEYSEK